MFSPLPHSVLFWLRLATVLQTALLLAAYVSVLRKDRLYPAMRAYLLINAIGGILIFTLLGLPGLFSGSESNLYCTLFWMAYGTSGVLTFFTAQQIFRDALDPFPGLRRLALVAFRWVATVSLALSVVPAIVPLFFFRHQSMQVTVLQAMRCVSVLEFCLLVFILLSAQALGITWRSRIVGITLGFGVLAVVDTVCFMFLLRSSTHLLSWLLVRESGGVLAAGVWLAYLLLREPQRQVVRLRSQSQLQKWNEIAVALGKPAPHIALSPEPSPFFLQDVEAVVDRVLSRNDMEPPAAH